MVTHTPLSRAFIDLSDANSIEEGEHRCARCGESTPQTVPARKVVSAKFTAFDEWITPGGPVCPVCAWGFTDARLRSKIVHLDSHDGTALIEGQRLAEILASPLPAHVAVVLPLRPGRKHLLPYARWGHVTVDDATVPWGTAAVDLRADLAWLRAAGMSVSQLETESLDFGFWRALDTASIPEALGRLDRIRPWRGTPTWMIGIRASTANSSRRT